MGGWRAARGECPSSRWGLKLVYFCACMVGSVVVVYLGIVGAGEVYSSWEGPRVEEEVCAVILVYLAPLLVLGY
jgi:hypothetical protein